MAGGAGPDLWPGEKKLPAAQVGWGLARDAPWGTNRSQGRLAGVRLLGTAEHGVYRTGESDGASWRLSAGTPHLGHGPAISSPLGSPGVVAGVLPFCPSSRIAAGEARAAS